MTQPPARPRQERAGQRRAAGSRRRRVALGCALVAAVIGVVGVAVFRIGFFFPPPVTRVPIQGPREASLAWSGESLRIMVWNVQYCASRRHHFFYDGGDAVHVPPEDVLSTVEAVADAIQAHDPDLVLLQEVDRDSARTGRVDQLGAILAGAPYGRWVAAPYHRVAYVPHPPGQHLGRVDMELATLSRFELSYAKRIQLPLLREPFYRRAFNLKRAVLEVTLPHDGGSLTVLNTHLSAFSFGDGTLEAQVGRIQRRLDELDRLDFPWILAGDFNMLPPGDDPVRLGDEAEMYADADNPIERLFDAGYRAVPDPTEFEADPRRWYTYLPHGAEEADRTLDYVFVSEGIEVRSARVLSEYAEISDHLPLLVEVEVSR